MFSGLTTIPATRIPDCFLRRRARVSQSKRFSVARNTFASTDLAEGLGHDMQPISPFQKNGPARQLVTQFRGLAVTSGPLHFSVTIPIRQHLKEYLLAAAAGQWHATGPDGCRSLDDIWLQLDVLKLNLLLVVHIRGVSPFWLLRANSR